MCSCTLNIDYEMCNLPHTGYANAKIVDYTFTVSP